MLDILSGPDPHLESNGWSLDLPQPMVTTVEELRVAGMHHSPTPHLLLTAPSPNHRQPSPTQCSSVLKHCTSMGLLNFGPQSEHQLAASGLSGTSLQWMVPGRRTWAGRRHGTCRERRARQPRRGRRRRARGKPAARRRARTSCLAAGGGGGVVGGGGAGVGLVGGYTLPETTLPEIYRPRHDRIVRILTRARARARIAFSLPPSREGPGRRAVQAAVIGRQR